MPAVARFKDAEAVHCSQPRRDGHVKTVFANSIPLSCQGHSNTVHLVGCGKRCCPHTSTLKRGSPNVFAEELALGRVGDPTCTRVIQGSPNVFANGL